MLYCTLACPPDESLQLKTAPHAPPEPAERQLAAITQLVVTFFVPLPETEHWLHCGASPDHEQLTVSPSGSEALLVTV